MGYFIFNEKLLRSLPSILKTSKYNIASMMDICHTTYINMAKRGDMRLTLLVKLCNKAKIDPLEFFPSVTQEFTEKVICRRGFEEVSINCDVLAEYELKPESLFCAKLARVISEHNEIRAKLFTGGKRAKYKSNEEEPVLVVAESDTNEIVSDGLKWYFNLYLWEYLPMITNKSKTEIASDVGDSVSFLDRIARVKRIRMTKLVQLCNANRLNILSFFINTPDGYIPDNILISEDKFTPIEFHPERILTIPNKDITSDSKYVLQGTIRKLLNITPSVMINIRQAENSTLMSDKLCEMCEKLGLNPTYFFDNHINNIQSKAMSNLLKENELISQELEDIKKRNKSLESQLRHAKAINKMGK